MVARKRKIRSDLRGISKRRKGMSTKMRKHRVNRTRPEVKFTGASFIVSDIWNRDVLYGSDLKVGDFVQLNNFPSRGTGDTDRIGDTVQGVKWYIRFALSSLTRVSSGYIRVIIFNLKETQAISAVVTGFWQSNVSRPTINGVVDREKVNKVFYDKVFAYRDQVAVTQTAIKFKTLNLSCKWPVVFQGNTALPKDSRNRLFLAAIGCTIDGVSDTTSSGRLEGNCNWYFYDS